MFRILIVTSGWAIFILYLSYEYGTYGKNLLSHLCHLDGGNYVQFIFHIVIILAPVASTIGGYLVYQRDKALRQKSEFGDKLQEALSILEGEKSKSAAILSGIGDAISIQDSNYKILYQNQVHKDMIGDHAGECCYRAYEGRDSICEGCPVAICFQDGDIHKAARSTITNKGQIYIEITASPLKNLSGVIIGGIEVVRDVTERKILEEHLRIQRNQAQQYLDVAGVMFLVLDTDQNITLLNKKGYEILGYREGELIGNNWLDLCVPNRIRKDVKAVFDGLMAGKIELMEYYENPVTTKSGDERTIAWHNTILRDNQNNIIGILSSGEDITERKQLEAQFLHAQKMEAIGRLAGGIAHDFNNVLSAIVAYGSLIKIDNTEDINDHVDQILALSSRAASLTRNLLIFSRKQIMLPEPVMINDIVRNVKDILSRLIGEDIELEMKLAEKDLNVMADSVQLEQILMNLATNARDAMPDGGLLTIGTECGEIDGEYIETYGYGTQGQYALITITDTGTGMDEETKQKIFEPFFTTKGVEKGTGLGLATIYGIVKQHKGFINVFSEPGQGSSFKIYLPLAGMYGEVKEEKEYADTSISGGETILLAEDEDEVRDSMKSILESFGYRVIEAVHGEDAVQKYKENKDRITFLILDVVMPKKNGLEACEEIKKMKPDVKFLFISGYPEDVLTDRGIIIEGLNLLFKPLLPGELFRKIKEISTG